MTTRGSLVGLWSERARIEAAWGTEVTSNNLRYGDHDSGRKRCEREVGCSRTSQGIGDVGSP